MTLFLRSLAVATRSAAVRSGTTTATLSRAAVPTVTSSQPPPASSSFSTAASAAGDEYVPPKGSVAGDAGWPPGLFVFPNFGEPTPQMAKGVIDGARNLLVSVDETRLRPDVKGPSSIGIPQPPQGRVSQAHNLAAEREFVPLKVPDPSSDPPNSETRSCEHFEHYGSQYHALTYFRGNHNIPSCLSPIMRALKELDVVQGLSPYNEAEGGGGGSGSGSAANEKAGGGSGDELGLHWKLTLNNYKPRPEGDKEGAALAEAGGALFPWHTDLEANGQITCIATLLAPAILEFAPHADAPGRPTTIEALPGSLVLLSGAARWEWVHRALPHPDAEGKERISLVLGCAPKSLPHMLGQKKE